MKIRQTKHIDMFRTWTKLKLQRTNYCVEDIDTIVLI